MRLTIAEFKKLFHEEMVRYDRGASYPTSGMYKVLSDGVRPDVWKREFKIRLYTETHSYQIIAREECATDGSAIPDGHTYFGGQASTRTPRPGEEHNRGHDLPDGELTTELWENIKSSIIAFELLPVVAKMEPMEDTIDAPENS